MKRITVTEAAKTMQIGEQGVRLLVQSGKIPGAVCFGSDKHLTYYITDVQVSDFMKGRISNAN